MDQEYQLTYISQATVLFLLEEHPFLEKLVQHLGTFRCMPLKDHLYYYYC